LGLGITGAALATEISAALSFLFGAWMLFSGKSQVRPRLQGLLRLDWEIDWQLLKIGLPQSLESLLRSIGDVFVLRFVAGYGTVALAAMGIVQRLAGFFFVPLNGIMSGGSTIVGQNLGAQQVERAEQTAKVAAGLGVGSMTALSLLVAAFPAQLLRLFTADADVIAMGCTIIYVLLPMLIIAGFAIGLATALVGAGYNFPFLISGVVSRWAVQLPFLFICVQVLQLPFVYAALSFTVAEVAGSSILIVAYLRGRWRTWRVTKPAEQRAETATA
ncbi:MAG TPA: MATE family efflux transporter, partial [Firmicutes bacterium]|nr:MATE family efflux transporter [Bacillota bacterium]